MKVLRFIVVVIIFSAINRAYLQTRQFVKFNKGRNLRERMEIKIHRELVRFVRKRESREELREKRRKIDVTWHDAPYKSLFADLKFNILVDVRMALYRRYIQFSDILGYRMVARSLPAHATVIKIVGRNPNGFAARIFLSVTVRTQWPPLGHNSSLPN